MDAISRRTVLGVQESIQDFLNLKKDDTLEKKQKSINTLKDALAKIIPVYELRVILRKNTKNTTKNKKHHKQTNK